MSKRPSQSSNTSDEICRQAAGCKCCEAIRRARECAPFDLFPEWRSPLTPGIQLVNLSRSEDRRTLRVDLGRDWRRMLAQLSMVGTGLLVTRNAATGLRERRACRPTDAAPGAAAGPHSLCFDVAEFSIARATHSRWETGNLFGVEFCDGEGKAVHGFKLIPESDFDVFFDWVRLHQACSVDDPEPLPYPVSAPAKERMIGSRVSDPGAVISVLAACCERLVAIEATIYTRGVQHRATFTPDALEREDHWWLVSDEVTGLHFDPALFTRVVVEELESSGFRLRCETEEFECAMRLGAGADTPRETWNEILRTLA